MKVFRKVIPVALAIAVLAVSMGGQPSRADVLNDPERKLAQQVFDLTQRDRYGEAEQAAMQSSDRVLAKLVRWMTYLSPRSGASFAEITSFIETSPDWPLMSQMQRRAEESLLVTTPDDQVLAWFDRHAPVTADGGIAYARALLAAGRGERAAASARRTWTEESFGTAQEKEFLDRFGQFLRPEDHRHRLDRLLWERQQAAAKAMLPRVDAEFRALAQARLALQAGKDKPEADLAKVPGKWRDDPGLIYDRVRWHRTNDQDEQAIDLLSHPARNKVRPDLWWQERAVLARRALQKGWVSQAYRVASENGLDPKSSLFGDGEFLAGWIALRFLDDRDIAARHFQKLWDASTTPMSLSRAAYWSGRAAEARGDKAGARTWYAKGAQYVTAYYGQLSAERLVGNGWSLATDPEPTREDIRRFETRELTRVARIMLEVGQEDYLRAFAIRLSDAAETAGERALVGKLVLEGGRHDLAVVVARRSDREGIFLTEAGWPVPPWRGEPDPEKALVLALMRQESGFDPDIQSPVGARGLMQLMPATAERVAKSLKVPFIAKRLDEPDYNMRLGSTYLAGLLDDFEGSYVLALAGYNAGPTRARRWSRDNGDPRDPAVDVIDWIEMIPFTETRTYVQRVMESVSIYRRKLGTPVTTMFEADLKRGQPSHHLEGQPPEGAAAAGDGKGAGG